MSRRPRLETVARVALLGLLAALALWFIDFRSVGRGLLAIPGRAIYVLLVVCTLDRVLMAVKWRHLLGRSADGVPLTRFLGFYYVASFLNYCIPTTIGGDVYRGAQMARELPHKRERVYASLVMEKVVGLAAAVLCAWVGLVWLVYAHGSQAARPVLVTLAIASLLGALFVAFSLSRGGIGLLAHALRRLSLDRASALLLRLHDAYRGFTRRKTRLLENLLLAVMENGLQYLRWLVAGAFVGVALGLPDFLAVVAVTTLLRRISLVLDSWGLSEAVTIAAFGAAGIAPSVALTISLVGHATNLLSVLPSGLLLLRRPVFAEAAHA